MAGKKGSELTTQDTTLAQYADYAGCGFENQTVADVSVPFLILIQDKADAIKEFPQLNLKPGDIFNPALEKVYPADEGIVVVPVYTEHHFVEWVPRKQGGGFVSLHHPHDPLIREVTSSQPFGKYKTPQRTDPATGEIIPGGNELNETFYVYCLDDEFNVCMIAFSSTKIKKYKQWMTKARGIQLTASDGRRVSAPLFSHRYRIMSFDDRNAEGGFKNLNVTFDSPHGAQGARLDVNDPLFTAAVEYHKTIVEGRAKADYAGAASGGSSSQNSEESDMPF